MTILFKIVLEILLWGGAITNIICAYDAFKSMPDKEEYTWRDRFRLNCHALVAASNIFVAIILSGI